MTTTTSRCIHCGAVLTPGARFCPECGRSAEARSSPLPLILGGLGGLVLIILLILLLRPHAPVTGAEGGGPKGPAVVAAPAGGPSGPPVIGANGGRPTGLPVAGANGGTPAPEDPERAAVAAYLAKMAEIERRRKQIVNNLYPAMLTMALLKGMGGMEDMLKMLDEDVTDEQKQQTQPPSAQKAQDTMQQYREQFRALAMDVQRIQPPTSARRFHNGYIVSLGSYDGVIGEIQNAVLSGDQSIGSRGGELQGQVSNILKADDDEMGRLLARYHLQRMFSVNDSQAGGITDLSP